MSTTPLSPHIFAVNHNPKLLELFAEFFGGAGCRVTTRTIGTSELESVIQLAPDLVVIDSMWLTDDDGWSLLQMLTTAPQTQAIPVVPCTALDMTVDTLVARLDGMAVHLVAEPHNLDDLLSEIHAAGVDAKPGA